MGSESMEVEYVAFDSFGVKSSCVKVYLDDLTLVIDPGIAEEVDSFPLPWEERLELTREYEEKIAEACREAEIIVISHYHYDHHLPYPEWYRGKVLLIKDPKKKINRSQFERAEYFLEKVKGVAKKIEIADSKRFRFGSSEISFSEPLWHGVPKTRLGYVLMTKVEDEEMVLVHSSDVDGPTIEEYADMIVKMKPDLLILDGSPTYLLGYIHSYYNLCRSVLNVAWIVRSGIKKVILDHHLVRDYRYPDLYKYAYEEAKRSGAKLLTAAEDLGMKPAVLRGFEEYGPTKWKNWKEIDEESILRILKNAKEKGLLPDAAISRTKEVLGKTLRPFRHRIYIYRYSI